LWKNLYSARDAVICGDLFLPIDPDFQTKRQVASEHSGHKVWGPVEPPQTLGIHGTFAAVDWDVCADVCPVSLYDMVDTPGHPLSQRKADPAREKDCIQCLACELQCPAAAIKITPPP
jgi:NAD-dependent dihydropyrimidine dehydrogenase PreA subunit